MKAIILNEYDEYVNPQPDTDGTLYFGIKNHGVCGGFVDLIDVSKTHQAFNCRKCNFRFVFPIEIKTWLELRRFANLERIKGRW